MPEGEPIGKPARCGVNGEGREVAQAADQGQTLAEVSLIEGGSFVGCLVARNDLGELSHGDR